MTFASLSRQFASSIFSSDGLRRSHADPERWGEGGSRAKRLRETGAAAHGRPLPRHWLACQRSAALRNIWGRLGTIAVGDCCLEAMSRHGASTFCEMSSRAPGQPLPTWLLCSPRAAGRRRGCSLFLPDEGCATTISLAAAKMPFAGAGGRAAGRSRTAGCLAAVRGGAVSRGILSVARCRQRAREYASRAWSKSPAPRSSLEAAGSRVFAEAPDPSPRPCLGCARGGRYSRGYFRRALACLWREGSRSSMCLHS